ncbi:MAG TPA: hypothetical protein VJ718_07865, partial [Candidatus Binataceae bacterium]|nr:hypothetical protein [Candidatus Binataceae bacterium]
SLSALIGTLSIPLIFVVAGELVDMPISPDSSEPETRGPSDLRVLAPAFAAIIFAANLVVIKYAREARMYPLALACGLVQIWFFLRAWRLGGIVNYAVCAISSALAIAANFSMALILLPQGIWLLAAMARTRSIGTRPLRIALALAFGLMLLVPAVIAGLRARGGSINLSVISWISPPPPWAPIALFNKASGSFAFPVMAGLAAWGAIRGWREARAGVIFALLWMFAAPFALLVVSYVLRPAFVERYVLACFAPFFFLVALGASLLESNALRVGAIALAVALAIGHVASYDRKPHGAQWREAALAAAANTPAGGAIAVAPPYAVNVARYYLRDSRDPPAAYPIKEDSGDTVIIADTGVSPAEAATLLHRYPRPLAHPRGLMIRRR